jgi:tRNA pseudouridine55 synthase
VLLVGLGRVTRLLRFLTELRKTYTCDVVFGTATTTLDADGEVTATWDMGAIDPVALDRAVAALTGNIMQVPPMVSAVRVDGQRLHALARRGIDVERAPRPVTVYALHLEPTAEASVWRMEATCSSGTYVRVLAADLGTALGGGAHLRDLRRTSIGSFSADRAWTLERLAATPSAAVIEPAAALADYPAVSVDEDMAALIANGRKLPTSELDLDGDGPCAVLAPDGRLLAVYERRGAEARPRWRL